MDSKRPFEIAECQQAAKGLKSSWQDMTDLARELQEIYGVPVVDGVAAAVKQAEALVSLGLCTSKRGSYATPLPKPFTGAMSAFSPILKVG